MKYSEYEEKARSFLSKHGLTLSIREAVPQKAPFWADGEYGVNYWVSIVNKDGKNYSFDYWGSIADKNNKPFAKHPTAYDILTCLDTYNDGVTFEDFCANYGYNTDSRKAEKTFNAVQYQTQKLKEILSEEAQNELNDIN